MDNNCSTSTVSQGITINWTTRYGFDSREEVKYVQRTYHSLQWIYIPLIHRVYCEFFWDCRKQELNSILESTRRYPLLTPPFVHIHITRHSDGVFNSKYLFTYSRPLCSVYSFEKISISTFLRLTFDVNISMITNLTETTEISIYRLLIFSHARTADLFN